ncbi:MAG: multidrug efflux MFS transporter [Microbacteriaceae bacterium]|nr:multidrug efflux MFS transporter [Microbacteriaceae bacterium]
MTPDAPSDSAPKLPASMTARDRLVIYLILASAFVVMLNETIIGVALPKIMEELRIEPATSQWLLTAFMLTMAVVIPLSGFFMRRFTSRQVYITAIALFSLGTFLAAIASDFSMLVVARVVQAVGTGVMIPLLMTTIMTLVPPHERGKMMGNITIVMSVAPALGPLVAGVILNSLDWRWVFWLVLPFGLAALALGIWKMENVSETAKVGIDVLSIPLAALAFGGLVYGLSETSNAVRGHVPLEPWIPIVIGAVALGLFIWRQIVLQRRDAPLMDLRTFAQPGFAVAIGLMAVVVAVMFGSIILLPIYIQDGLGYEPIVAGLAVLPGGLLQGVAGPFVGRLYDRLGPRPLLVPATILSGLALVGFATFLGTETPIWVIIALHIAMSVSLAFTFPPLMNSAMGALTPKLYASGSAVVGTAQQLFGAAGTAALIVVFTLGSAAAVGGAGASEAEAVVAGTHVAFLVAAFAAIAPIVLALFIRRPASELGGGHGHGPGAGDSTDGPVHDPANDLEFPEGMTAPAGGLH